MSPQRRSIAPLFDVPQPDRLVKAATRQDASIGTPGDTTHLAGMPAQRLLQAHAGHICTQPFGGVYPEPFAPLKGKLRRSVPQLDCAIPARAGQCTTVGCKGQSIYKG